MPKIEHNKEFKLAKEYFESHKGESDYKYNRQQSGLKHSYIITPDNIILKLLTKKDDKVDSPYILGKGSFGRVK